MAVNELLKAEVLDVHPLSLAFFPVPQMFFQHTDQPVAGGWILG